MLKSSDKGSDKEEVVFLKNKAEIWSRELETDDFKKEIALDTTSTAMSKSTISEKFEKTLEKRSIAIIDYKSLFKLFV